MMSRKAITDENEKKEFLESLGLVETGLKRVIRKGYEILNYINFFTAGEKELRAWTIIKGSHAPTAARTFHSDICTAGDEAGVARLEAGVVKCLQCSHGDQGNASGLLEGDVVRL